MVVRFPWGVFLETRCGSSAAPLDLASGGRRLAAPPSSSISAGAFHYNPGHSRGQERGAIDEAVSLTSFDRSIRGAPLRPAPFQRRGCEPLSDLLGPRGAFTEYRRSLTLSLSPAGTPESVSETARSAGRLSYALAGRELSRTLTCKPKDPGTPDPCESDAQQPESAFRRIANLRAFTRRPIKR